MEEDIDRSEIVEIDEKVVPEDMSPVEYADQIIDENEGVRRVEYEDESEGINVELTRTQHQFVPIEAFIELEGEDYNPLLIRYLEILVEEEIGSEIPLFPEDKEEYIDDAVFRDNCSDLILDHDIPEWREVVLGEPYYVIDETQKEVDELKEEITERRIHGDEDREELEEEYIKRLKEIGPERVETEEQQENQVTKLSLFGSGEGEAGTTFDQDLWNKWVDENYNKTVTIENILINLNEPFTNSPYGQHAELLVTVEECDEVCKAWADRKSMMGANALAYELSGSMAFPKALWLQEISQDATIEEAEEKALETTGADNMSEQAKEHLRMSLEAYKEGDSSQVFMFCNIQAGTIMTPEEAIKHHLGIKGELPDVVKEDYDKLFEVHPRLTRE